MQRILFVDDHPIFGEGVKRTLEAEIAGLHVLLQADARGALTMLEARADIDLLLTDYKLPDEDGLSLITSVRRLFPTVGTGLICADLSFSLLARAHACGVVLCISKARAASGIVSAIRTVFDGGQVFDDAIGEMSLLRLSPRRKEILVLASQGLSDKVIGARLGVSENTVRNHWKHIFVQLRVSGRTEAVGKAIRQGTI